MESKKYFLLYQNNISVKGVKRSIICDLHRQSYYFITNELNEIILYLQKNTINKTLDKFKTIKREQLLLKLYELIELDLGHFTNSPNSFPQISATFSTPYEIQDSIVELSEINLDNIDGIFKSLTNLGCQTLELRGYDIFSLKQLTQILLKLTNTRIRNVEIFLHESDETNLKNLTELVSRFQIIGSLHIHSCKNGDYNHKDLNIVFSEKAISSAKCCGFISTDNFTVNLPFFLESRKSNSCLNKKISIDQFGNIKNCPIIPTSFGNITEKKLEDILLINKFKKYWTVSKDQIKTCKDCEFRYICSDCRAFIENPKDIYSKPLKCGYNPHTTTWEEWSASSIKGNAIKHYEI